MSGIEVERRVVLQEDYRVAQNDRAVPRVSEENVSSREVERSEAQPEALNEAVVDGRRAVDHLDMQAPGVDSLEHGQMDPVGETSPQRNPCPSLPGEGNLAQVGGSEDVAPARSQVQEAQLSAIPPAPKTSLENLKQYASTSETSDVDDDDLTSVMTNGEATTQQFDGSTPPPTKRRRTHRTNWYRFKRGAPVASRGALGACRQQPRQLLETWARAGQCRKRVMWARASEEERTKLFLSSVPTLRRLLLQWSPNQILAAERKKLEQLLSQPKAQFPNPPKETLEHEKNRAKGPPKAHLLPKGLRTTQGCSSSSAESQLSQEGQHQRSHDWKKTKRVGEADNPGPLPTARCSGRGR